MPAHALVVGLPIFVAPIFVRPVAEVRERLPDNRTRKRRSRGMGLPGQLALLCLVFAASLERISGFLGLAFWLVLCAVPGTIGEDRYWPDPLF